MTMVDAAGGWAAGCVCSSLLCHLCDWWSILWLPGDEWRFASTIAIGRRSDALRWHRRHRKRTKVQGEERMRSDTALDTRARAETLAGQSDHTQREAAQAQG